MPKGERKIEQVCTCKIVVVGKPKLLGTLQELEIVYCPGHRWKPVGKKKESAGKDGK